MYATLICTYQLAMHLAQDTERATQGLLLDCMSQNTVGCYYFWCPAGLKLGFSEGVFAKEDAAAHARGTAKCMHAQMALFCWQRRRPRVHMDPEFHWITPFRSLEVTATRRVPLDLSLAVKKKSSAVKKKRVSCQRI